MFEKGFELKILNSIHPARSKGIAIAQKPEKIYDWRYVPFLKESGDTILSNTSPINFRKVYLDESTLEKSYVNMKCIVGRILSFSKNDIQIQVPSLYNAPLTYLADISESVKKQLSMSAPSRLSHFVIFEHSGININDTIIRLSPATPLDLAGHLLSFSLYTLRLANKGLKLLSYHEYERIYNRCCNIVYNFCRIEGINNYNQLFDPKDIFATYLSPYFRLIDNEIYFIPHNQLEISDSIIKVYDKCLLTDQDSISSYAKESHVSVTRRDVRLYDFIKFFMAFKKFVYFNYQREDLFWRITSEFQRSKVEDEKTRFSLPA